MYTAPQNRWLHEKQFVRGFCHIKSKMVPTSNLRCKRKWGRQQTFTFKVHCVYSSNRESLGGNLLVTLFYSYTCTHFASESHSFIASWNEIARCNILCVVAKHFQPLFETEQQQQHAACCHELLSVFNTHLIQLRYECEWVQRVSFLVQNSIKSLVGNVFALFK